MSLVRVLAVPAAAILTILAVAAAIRSATSVWIDWDDKSSVWTWVGWGLLSLAGGASGWRVCDWFDDLFDSRKGRE